MDLREIGLGGVDWNRLAQDRDRWRAVVSAVMNLRVLAPRSLLVSHKRQQPMFLHTRLQKSGLGLKNVFSSAGQARGGLMFSRDVLIQSQI
jgi:hypothetical protein